MAKILFVHSAEIRNSKQIYFDRDKIPTARLLKGKGYFTKREMMMNIIEKQKQQLILSDKLYFFAVKVYLAESIDFLPSLQLRYSPKPKANTLVF